MRVRYAFVRHTRNFEYPTLESIYSEKMEVIKQCEPKLYYYPPTDFHVTVFDLATG